MNKLYSVVLLLVLGLYSCTKEVSETTNHLKLWYVTPADAITADNPDPWTDDTAWLKALPLGNGSLGAMVFGGVNNERIQLNEETIWSGSPQESDNPQAAAHLDKIKELLFAGKYKEATELTNRTQVCTGSGSGSGVGAAVPFGCFQTMGDLWIDFDNKAAYTDYYRELDLNEATARVSYVQDGVTYRREMFVSYPAQAMVVKLTASQAAKLSFTCKMARPEHFRTYSENNQLIMTGALSDGKGGEGLQYMARLSAAVQNGTLSLTDSTLSVSSADEVVLYLTASTDYQLQYPTYKGRDYATLSANALQKAMRQSYTQLREDHLKEYQSYYNRAEFSLAQATDTVPTDISVQRAREGQVSPHLYELMFQYGRYLLISSSRPGTLPANLQGIWANKIQTPWNGDYHTDVNVEMNYWPAEVTNLSECHLPLFDLIASLVDPGTRTARIQYNKKGWVVHPITNVWGYTSPGEYASWGMHTGAPAWICQHIYEHYRFTGDEKFLKDMYPVLKGAVEFYMDWLTVDPKTGKLVSGPAVSPENTFVAPDGSHCQISMGPSHDQQTIWQLFTDFIDASHQLSVSDAFVSEVLAAREKLLGIQVGSDGRIMEWAEEFPEVEPGHRHISHLFALHPGAQINPLQTPDLTQAASKSLDYRIEHGGGHTGWSAAWLVSLYARLQQSDKALACLDKVLMKSLNPNLFTLCPPFQIDANFGTTAGIAEMLLQSHVLDGDTYVIQILPSLPAEWQTGGFTGLKARGGFEVSARWKNGKLTAASVKSLLGHKCRIVYGGSSQDLQLSKGQEWKW